MPSKRKKRVTKRVTKRGGDTHNVGTPQLVSPGQDVSPGPVVTPGPVQPSLFWIFENYPKSSLFAGMAIAILIVLLINWKQKPPGVGVDIEGNEMNGLDGRHNYSYQIADDDRDPMYSSW